jgi:hypothetical protein
MERPLGVTTIKIRTFLIVLTLVVVAHLIVESLSIQCWQFATMPSGAVEPLALIELYSIGLFLLCICAFIVSFILSFIEQLRFAAVALLVGSLTSLVLIPFFHGGAKVRDKAFYEFVERSEVLIQAIEKYEHENGEPPENLQALVPKYLQNIPATGMGGFPEFHYTKGGHRYYQGRWILSVPVGTIPFDWTELECRPTQDYPSYQRYGRWALVNYD